MRKAILGTMAAVVLPMVAALSAAPSPAQGKWVAGHNGGEKLQFTLIWGSSTIWVQEFALSELRGFSERAVAGGDSTPVSFRVERDAGVFEFEGVAGGRKGTGRFVFQPSSQYTRTLRSSGLEGTDQLTQRDLMLLALRGTSTTEIQELTGLGLGSLAAKEVVELAVHGVTPDYVRSLRSVGLPGTNTVSGLVRMRLHRVTADYVRELKALGFDGLSHPQLLKMSIHGVTPAFIRHARETGVRDLSPESLVRMKIHGQHR